MSFYGSVYYQLVDTFYKIVAKNNGRNNNNFLSKLEDEMPNQAVGRKGVIELDAGNRWINISDAKAQDSASYQIWHGAPDSTTVKPDNGFKVLLTDKEIKDRTQNGVIYLQDADQFETYENTYDNAGHIASSVKKTYRLPKAEVVEEVEELQALVGVPNGKQLPKIDDKTLYGYTAENYKDITQLEKYIGEWNQTIKYDPDRFAGTIAAVIGNINTMLGVSGNVNATSFKSLTDVIGKIKDLDEKDLYATSSDKPLNIIDGLVKLQKALKSLNVTVDSNKVNSEGQTNGIWSAIGEKIDNDSIYDHIKTIYGDDNGNVTDSLTTLANRTQSLEDKDKSLENKDKSLDKDIETINGKLGSGWSSADTVRKAVTDINNNLGAGWNSTDTVSKAIADINTKLGWTRADSILVDITDIEGNVKNLKDHAEKSEKDIDDLKVRAQNIEKAALSLAETVNTNQTNQNAENTKLYKADSELDQRITGLVNTIGSVPESTTVIALIEKANKDFKASIGNLPEDSNVIKEIESAETRLQDQIDSFSKSLGTVPDGKNAYSLIDKNITDIQTINNKIGSINAENPISELISENTRLIAGIQTDYVTKEAAKAYLTTEAAAETYAPLGIIGDTSSWENPDNTIVAKINSLEGKIDSVEKIVGNEEELEEGQTIISLLLELKKEIADIRNAIDEFHPTDPPTPDGEEPVLPPEIGEEEEEGPVE